MTGWRKVMKIGSEIEKTAKSNAIYIERLCEKRAETIKRNITKEYVYSYSDIFLWEQFKAFAVKQIDDGWQKLCDFVGNKSCLMFFDNWEDEAVFVLKNGQDLYRLLGEMYGFEFYITDFETEYLLCFNHHDCLLGCGRAKKWVESINE